MKRFEFSNRGKHEVVEADSYRVQTQSGGSFGTGDRMWVSFERKLPNPPEFGLKVAAFYSTSLDGQWTIREIEEEESK